MCRAGIGGASVVARRTEDPWRSLRWHSGVVVGSRGKRGRSPRGRTTWAGLAFALMPANSAASHADQQVCALGTLPGRRQAADRPQEVAKTTRFHAKPTTARRRFRRSDHFPHVDRVVVASRPIRRTLCRQCSDQGQRTLRPPPGRIQAAGFVRGGSSNVMPSALDDVSTAPDLLTDADLGADRCDLVEYRVWDGVGLR